MKNKTLSLALVLLMTIAPVTALAAPASTPANGKEEVPTELLSSAMPHYINENFHRYAAYQAQNPNLNYEIITALVNVNADIGFFQNIQAVYEPNSTAALVNKNFILPSDYVPDDLTDVGGGHKMRAEAAEQFLKMRDALYTEGLSLYARSAYRSYATQANIYSSRVVRDGEASADRWNARPGHSEHQTGLAVDVSQHSGGASLASGTMQYDWMVQNAHQYGFILRYPENLAHIHGYSYEPWHWRYIGVEAATIMYDEGMATYEEYYGRYFAPFISFAEPPLIEPPTQSPAEHTAISVPDEQTATVSGQALHNVTAAISEPSPTPTREPSTEPSSSPTPEPILEPPTASTSSQEPPTEPSSSPRRVDDTDGGLQWQWILFGLIITGAAIGTALFVNKKRSNN